MKGKLIFSAILVAGFMFAGCSNNANFDPENPSVSKPSQGQTVTRFNTARDVVEATITDLSLTQNNNGNNRMSRFAMPTVSAGAKVYCDINTEKDSVEILMTYISFFKEELLKVNNLEFDTPVEMSNDCYNSLQSMNCGRENFYLIVKKTSDTSANIIFAFSGKSGDGNPFYQSHKITNYFDSDNNLVTKYEQYWGNTQEYYLLNLMKNDERVICLENDNLDQLSYYYSDINGKFTHINNGSSYTGYMYRDNNGGVQYYSSSAATYYAYFADDYSLMSAIDENGSNYTIYYPDYELEGENIQTVEWLDSYYNRTKSASGHNNNESSSVGLNVLKLENTYIIPDGITLKNKQLLISLEEKIDPGIQSLENLATAVACTAEERTAAVAELNSYFNNITIVQNN